MTMVRISSHTMTQGISRHPMLPDQRLDWNYEVFSPPKAREQTPTLYWSHGLGGSVSTERDFAIALANRGVRVVAIDYPGCGHSAWFKTHRGALMHQHIRSLEDREKIFSLFIEGALAIIRNDRTLLTGTHYAIGGHSLGGVTSVRLAHHFADDPLLLGLLNCVAFHSLGETHERPAALRAFLELLVGTSSLQAWFPVEATLRAKLAIAHSALTLANISHGHSDVSALVSSTYGHLARRPNESTSAWRERFSTQEQALATHARMSDFASTSEALGQLKRDQDALGIPYLNIFAEGDPLLGPPERLVRDHASKENATGLVLGKRGRIPGPGHLALYSHTDAVVAVFAGFMRDPLAPLDVSDFLNAGLNATVYNNRNL